jgi:hypothetical protein
MRNERIWYSLNIRKSYTV